ncbi:hypothetical protein CCACVL1_18116 [Corchorus capsularis]|uniref:Uncharacterized protein n=1 Tax=Corchorus capsularis TaxID=210143 RepID=A0A1R3HMV4_COCAP|nr:hypothetical protein CCACVL1_18116 [Corchorus capsularis]
MDQSNTYNTNDDHQEELEETLSFCDLPLENYQDLDHHDYYQQSPSSPSHELFEFPSLTPNTPLNNRNDIVAHDDDEIGRYLFPLSSARHMKNSKEDLGSLYLVNQKPNSSYFSAKNLRSQSCSSSSSSLKKHKVFIGLKTIPQKMELSDIKKRQVRKSPSPMFPPVPAGSLELMAAGDGCRGGGAGGRSHHWGLLRPLRCRAHFASALAKASLGCIPHV